MGDSAGRGGAGLESLGLFDSPLSSPFILITW